MEYKYINATALITTGQGFLDKVNIGTSVANSTVTFYDSPSAGVSAAKIAVLSCGAAAPPSFDFGRSRFETGLYAVVSTGNPDITVSFE